jgi:hypothetical protein
MFKRLLNNKKGTAEVVGSVLFIVILLFFFTNVYLWHDAAVKEMNDLQVRRMNAGMAVVFQSGSTGSANITAHGSEVELSRIWIVTTANQHLYANLEDDNIHLVAGKLTRITFGNEEHETDGSIKASGNADVIYLSYPVSEISQIKVLNTLGIIV